MQFHFFGFTLPGDFATFNGLTNTFKTRHRHPHPHTHMDVGVERRIRGRIQIITWQNIYISVLAYAPTRPDSKRVGAARGGDVLNAHRLGWLCLGSNFFGHFIFHKNMHYDYFMKHAPRTLAVRMQDHSPGPPLATTPVFPSCVRCRFAGLGIYLNCQDSGACV